MLTVLSHAANSCDVNSGSRRRRSPRRNAEPPGLLHRLKALNREIITDSQTIQSVSEQRSRRRMLARRREGALSNASANASSNTIASVLQRVAQPKLFTICYSMGYLQFE